METLVQAIDKATRAGVFTLEETAKILDAIKTVGQQLQAPEQGVKQAPLAPVTEEA